MDCTGSYACTCSACRDWQEQVRAEDERHDARQAYELATMDPALFR